MITFGTNLIGYHIYSGNFTDEKLRKEAWFLPNKECFDIQGLITFLKMGIPSIGMICLEWWSFEILILFSAYISMTATSANIIVLNTAVTSFMPALGL